MENNRLEWLKEQAKKQRANDYPKISQIKQLLEQGAFLAISYKGNNRPKAYIILNPQSSCRIKPSTITYLEDHNLVEYSHSRNGNDWVAHYYHSKKANPQQ